MAWNALAAYLCESVTLVDPSNMAVERLQVLLPLIKVAADISGSNGYDEDDILSLKSESSDGYDEGDSSDELDSDGSIDRASIGADHDMKMLDGDKTCSLRCSDLSEQEARDNPPPTKTSSIRNALEIAAKDLQKWKFLKKATEDEIREQRLRENDQWECTKHNNEYLERISGIYQQNRKRELAKERQRRHRMKKKQSEIEARIRSPGGMKRKVSNKTPSQGFHYLLYDVIDCKKSCDTFHDPENCL